MSRQRNTLTDKGIYLLPSFLTVMAMFAGFYAIIAGIKGMFDTACVAVFLAMLFDSLDGRVARLVNTETAFGAELDSLSDMLCFGVTPAVLLYLWNLSYLGKLGWLAAFTYTVAVALRLARFNTMSGSQSKRFFQGLASTAAAGFVAGGLFVGDRYNLGGHWVDICTAAFTFIVSGLMVSNVPYRSFKDIDLRGKMPFLVPCLLVLVVVLIVLEPAEFLCSVFTLYTLSGPVGYLVHLARKKLRKKRHA